MTLHSKTLFNFNRTMGYKWHLPQPTPRSRKWHDGGSFYSKSPKTLGDAVKHGVKEKLTA